MVLRLQIYILLFFFFRHMLDNKENLNINAVSSFYCHRKTFDDIETQVYDFLLLRKYLRCYTVTYYKITFYYLI